MKNLRVLLLDDCWVQTYYLADGLRRNGCEVHLVCSHPPRTIGRMMFATSHRADPIDGDAAQELIDRVVRDSAITHVLPMTDLLIDRYRKQPPAWHDLILPTLPSPQLEMIRDKTAMSEFIGRLGVPVPEEYPLVDPGSLEAGVRELGLPVVVRTRESTAGNGVAIADDLPQVREAVARFESLGRVPYLQQFAGGAPIISAGLFHEGRALRYYASEKLAIHPARTGPATIMKSLADQTLRDHTVRIFEALRWTGYGQLDWVRSADGRILFLEMNPRPWGAWGAAARAGVDLAGPFVELISGKSPAADITLRDGVVEYLFPQYLRAGATRNGALTMLDWRGWRHMPWHRPVLAAHLLKWLFRDLRYSTALQARRRLGLLRGHTLALPAPKAPA